jgi:glycerol uptake facilitator-like aquaporin
MVKTKELQKYAVEFIAECFATCILILIGEGGIANYKFTRQISHSTLPISLSFGVGVYSGNINTNKFILIYFILALMIAGPVSGKRLF